MTRDSSLREIDEDLWCVEAPQHYIGLPVGTRMTVLRSGGALMLISPVKLQESIVTSLARLGKVRHIVAPNNFHYLHAEACKLRYPDAVLWAAPGLGDGKMKINCDRQLPGSGEFVEKLGICRLDSLATMGLTGPKPADEHVFLHRPSRTLITTDLIFNFPPDASRRVRGALRLLGSRPQPGMTALERWATPDKSALWESFQPVLGWQYDRVIMAHGEIIESGGKADLEDCMREFCGRA